MRTERGAGWCEVVVRRARKVLMERRERRRRRLGEGVGMGKLGEGEGEKVGRKNCVRGGAEMMCKDGKRG